MDWEAIKKLSPDTFFKVIKLALWVTQGKELGMELTYQDQELMLFRLKENNVNRT